MSRKFSEIEQDLRDSLSVDEFNRFVNLLDYVEREFDSEAKKVFYRSLILTPAILDALIEMLQVLPKKFEANSIEEKREIEEFKGSIEKLLFLLNVIYTAGKDIDFQIETLKNFFKS